MKVRISIPTYELKGSQGYAKEGKLILERDDEIVRLTYEKEEKILTITVDFRELLWALTAFQDLEEVKG